MNKAVIVLLCACISINAQTSNTIIGGGLALAVGDWSDNMNPGLHLTIEPNRKINSFFGIGSHIDYSWLTAHTDISGLQVNVHLIDIAFVPKGYLQISSMSQVFLEVDPALLLAFGNVNYRSSSESELKLYFALTYGAGFNINRFVMGFKMKNAFTENTTAQWINLYVGYEGG